MPLSQYYSHPTTLLDIAKYIREVLISFILNASSIRIIYLQRVFYCNNKDKVNIQSDVGICKFK